MYYSISRGEVKAVDGVSFSIEKGEVIGLSGESGSGKSTVALAIMGLLPPSARVVSGQIIFDGVNLLSRTEEQLQDIRGKRIAMIFQGSMNVLNPMMKIGEQIAEVIVRHEGVDWSTGRRRAAEPLEMVGIDPSRVDNYPHEFSGGMKQRTVIAMALACNPDLIIADEPTTALDVIVQAHVLKLLKNLQKHLSLSILLISHDLSILAYECDQCAILYAGKNVEQTDVRRLYGHPVHPYTQSLIKAFPKITGGGTKTFIPGDPPDMVNPPKGCRFHPRCSYAMEVCKKKKPEIFQVEPGHSVACHLLKEGRSDVYRHSRRD